MKYLGVDYGSKNIGLAISDEEGMMAFPYKKIKNNNFLIDTIHNICGEEDIEAIVIGESENNAGSPNEIMKDIKIFAEKLNLEIGLPNYFEKEFMTSLHANISKTKSIFNARKIKVEKNSKDDAKAATLILQRFLDRTNQK